MENERNLVSVAARVEPQLAEAVRRIADAGGRSVSREIRRALTRHGATESRGDEHAASPPPEAA